MDINKVLQELDALPGGEDVGKTGDFLEEHIRLAREEGDRSSELALLNEMIGYCRYTGRYEDAYRYGDEAVSLCRDMGLGDDQPYATTLLNLATAQRAGGKLEASLENYRKVEALYDGLIDKRDYLYAALYNNMSLLYQAMEDFAASAECLEAALEIVAGGNDTDPAKEPSPEEAISRTNLAQAYLWLGRIDDAESQLKEAERIFETTKEDEFHYSGCLNAMAELYFVKKDYSSAISYYKKALKLLKIHVGEDNPSYLAVQDNLNRLYDTIRETDAKVEDELRGLGESGIMRDGIEVNEDNPEDGSDKGDEEASVNKISGMELSRRFYEEYGRSMIHDRFSQYEDRITVGLVGRGSQCYGFDDEISRDHDFGPDFCMWLDDDVYGEIGIKLQCAYDELPKEFMGFKRVDTVPPDGRRVGVIRTKEFYSRILEVSEDYLNGFIEGKDEVKYSFFASVKEEHLSACTNGEIFSEGKGDFLKIRNKLSYYPDILWKRRIAEELHYSAQMGQYNYIRMLKRGEKVASEIALAGYMEHTMKLVYLINRRYAPYYKWLHRGMRDLEKAAVIMDIFNAVYDMPKGDVRIRMTTEIVAAIIIEELERIGMAGNVPKEEKYLDVYSRVIYDDAMN